jgi:hypothetical protein
MPRRAGPATGRKLAEEMLRRLLDKIEANPDRRNRVSEALPAKSHRADDRDELHGMLAEAEACGGVGLEWGRRENSHNIERVVLRDPDALYRMLGRKSQLDIAKDAYRHVSSRVPAIELRDAMKAVFEGWARRRNVVRDLGPDAPENAALAFQAAARLLAVRRGSTGNRDAGMDLRTFSRRATGDSKFVESNKGKIADIVRMASADVPGYLDAGEVLELHGVYSWPAPCLLAGPVTYEGVALPAAPYVGIAPEMAPRIGVAGTPKWVLTVENLASFNRQVREATDADSIVLYTGGFPSSSTLDALLAITRATDCPILHWGDIDPGGVKIAYLIERALERAGKRLALHLMSPDLAARHGSPAPPVQVFRRPVAEESIVGELAAYLASPQACWLEQEELDPSCPLHP